MTIAIDASKLLTQTPTGVEVYCRQIISALLVKSNNLVLYTPKTILSIPAQHQKILFWPSKFLWSQIRLGLELFFNPPHIFFSPGYVIPFLALLNKQTTKIVTIHDLAFIHDSKSYSAFQKWFLTLTTNQAVKYAHKIIVPTQATQHDLIKYFNCSDNKIEVTYFGAPTQFNGSPSTAPQKQILYLGRIEAKKNIFNLIKAFAIFYKKYPDYQLILAGKAGHGYKQIKAVKYKEGITILGYISHRKKNQLLSESSCLVLVSKYEGFGFPLLEGFSHQIPVLASNIPVLKEIGDNACLFVDPTSPEYIANGLEKITQDDNLRQELITQGKIRLKDFSWQKCVDDTWQILSQKVDN